MLWNYAEQYYNFDIMSVDPEMTPPGTPEIEQFCAEDWLGTDNEKLLVYAYRNELLKHNRAMLRRLEPQLAVNGGISYYETYAYEAQHRILITNNFKIAGDHATVISINSIRDPLPDEPVYPHGHVMELMDISLHPKNKSMNSGTEVLYQEEGVHSWHTPRHTTVLIAQTNGLRLFGNLAKGDFVPTPAYCFEDVESDSESLSILSRVLPLCTPAALREDITQFD